MLMNAVLSGAALGEMRRQGLRN